jgi:hypothetical protein
VSTVASTNSGTDAWTIRSGLGPVSAYNSDLRGHSHTTFRMHENSANQSGMIAVIYNTTLMNDGEARLILGWHQTDTGPGPGDGLIVDSSRLYAYSTGGGCTDGDSSNIDAPFSRYDDNVFYTAGSANYSQSTLDTAQAAAPSGTHTDSGNTWTTWSAQPAWGGAGDPTTVPLPAGQVAATFGRGGAACTFSGL